MSKESEAEQAKREKERTKLYAAMRQSLRDRIVKYTVTYG